MDESVEIRKLKGFDRSEGILSVEERKRRREKNKNRKKNMQRKRKGHGRQ